MSSRETKQIKIADFDIQILTFLTWGETEKGSLENVGATMAMAGVSNNGLNGISGNPLLELKYQRLETAIKEIKQGDHVIPFSRNWMDQLSPENGSALYSEIENLFTKKK